MIFRSRPSTRLLSLSALAAACTLAPLSGCRHRNPMPTPAEENTIPLPNPAPDTQPNTQPQPNQNEPGVPAPKPNRRPKPNRNRDVQANADLPVTLKSDKATYRRGEIITFTMTLRNASTETQRLRFNSGQNFELVARQAEAAAGTPEAWRWSAGKMFTFEVRDESLRAGEERTFTATWDQSAGDGQPLPRGSYTVAAEIASIPRLPSNPVAVELND